MRIDVWSDVVCPWCYIGKRRLEAAIAVAARPGEIDVRHRAFQLNPDVPPGETSSRRAMLMRKYGLTVEQVDAMDARMAQTAAVDGLEYHLGADQITGNTRRAHEVIQMAGERGVQDAVVERLFRAYFTEGRSVFDDDALVDLAAEAGLAADDVRRALEQGTYGRAVEADIAEARRLGCHGVPFFVLDQRFGVSGAQPVDVFVEALARVAR